mmetsp:Transcript_861/g.2099  ORF Transcript_861/g.2099 Transcript_861/m.2099 type:complete len:241 (-) Transcript_861:1544-2266(-)
MKSHGSRRAILGNVVKHRLQKRRKISSLLSGELVLLLKHLSKRPEAKLLNRTKLTVAVEKVARVLAASAEVLRNWANKFKHESEVVVVARVVRAALRVKKKVPRRKLKQKACEAPHVRRRAVAPADDHLGAAVLPRLNVLRELLVRPARVAEIDHLNTRTRQLVLLTRVILPILLCPAGSKATRGSSQRNRLLRRRATTAVRVRGACTLLLRCRPLLSSLLAFCLNAGAARGSAARASGA